jgi:hypothetical protein
MRTLLPFTLAAALLAALPAFAGTADQPEVTDPQDQAPTDASVDLLSAWMQEDLGLLNVTFLVDLYGIPDIQAMDRVGRSIEWTLAFDAGGDHWQATLFHGDGPESDAADGLYQKRVTRNGQVLNLTGLLKANPTTPADGVALVEYSQLTLTWQDYGAWLPQGTVLSNFQAWSRLSTATASTTCAGQEVTDCAPDTAPSAATYTIRGGLRPKLDDLRLTLDPATATAQPGARVSFKATVQNQGQEHRVVRMQARAPPGWSVSFTPEELHLQPGAAGQANGTMQVPSNATGTVAIDMQASVAGGLANATFLVQLPAAGAPAPFGLQVVGGPGHLHAGESGTWQVQVTNNANVQRTFRLEESAEGLTADLPGNVTVDGGAMASVSLTLTGTEAGGRNVTVRAWPADAPDAVRTASIHVDVEAHEGKGSPSVPVGVLAVAFAGLALRRRR